MATMRKGDKGMQVSELQLRLVQHGYAAAVDGVFDTRTWQALRAFQAQNLDQHGQPLVVDGVAGPLTWWSLNHPKPFIETPTAVDYATLPASGGSALGRAALAAAIGELHSGACEEGGNNCGPFVRKYLAPAGVAEGNPWCASFVSWCYSKPAAAAGRRCRLRTHPARARCWPSSSATAGHRRRAAVTCRSRAMSWCGGG